MTDRMDEIDALFDEINMGAEEQGTRLGTDQGLGYAANLNEETAKNLFGRQDFIQDIMDYYQERDGATFSSIDAARDYFMNDRRWRNMNTFAIGADVYDINNQSDAQTTRLARLQSAFDALPHFYQEGGDGWAGFWTNAKATLADPINLVGFGSGAAAAKATAMGVAKKAGDKVLTKAAQAQLKKDATRAGLKSAVYKGGRNEAIASGIAEGVLDYGVQTRNTELGLQDGYSATQGAASVLGGAAIGGAMGTVLGPLGAVVPNPFKGGQNAISEGVIAGRNLARADAADRRFAETEAGAGAETAPPVDPVEEQIKQVQSRTAKMREADAPQGDATSPVKVRTTAEATQADRAERAAIRMRDLGTAAKRADQDAEAAAEKGDAGAADALRAKAIELRNLQQGLSSDFARLLSDDPSPDNLVDDISVKDEQAQLLLDFDPTATNTPQSAGSGVMLNPTNAEASANAQATATLNNQTRINGDEGYVGQAGGDPQEFKGGVETPEPSLSPEDEAMRIELEQRRTEGEDLKANIADKRKALDEASTVVDAEDIQDLDDGARSYIASLSDGPDALTGIDLYDRPPSQLTVDIAKRNGIDVTDADTSRTIGNKIKARAAEIDAARASREEGDKVQKTAVEAATRDLEIAQTAYERHQQGMSEMDGVYNVLNDAERAILEADQKRADQIDFTNAAAKLDQEKRELAKQGHAESGEAAYNERPDNASRIDFLQSMGWSKSDVDAVFSKFDRRTNKGKVDAKEAFIDMFEKAYVAQKLTGFKETLIIEEPDGDYLLDSWYNLEVNEVRIKDMFQTEAMGERAYKRYVQIMETSSKATDAYIDVISQNPDARPLTAEAIEEALAERYGSGFAQIAMRTDPLRSEGLQPQRIGGPEKPTTQSERTQFIESLHPQFKIKLNAMQEQLLNHYLAQDGVTVARAKEIAERVFENRLERAMRGQDDIVDRSNKAMDEDIRKNYLYIEDLQKAHHAYLQALGGLPMEPKRRSQFQVTLSDKKKLIIKPEDITKENISGGNLKYTRPVRYNLKEVGTLDFDEAQDAAAIDTFIAARSAMRDLASRDPINKGKSVGQIVEELEQLNIKLERKKSTTVKILKRPSGVRSSTDVSFKPGEYNAETGEFDLPDDYEDKASYIGRQITRRGDGRYEVSGKVQASIRQMRNSSLIQRAKAERTGSGARERLSGPETASRQIKKAAIDRGTDAMVSNPQEAERNKLQLKPVQDAIDAIDKAKSALYSAEKAVEKGPTKKYSLEELEDRVVEKTEALAAARAAGKPIAGVAFINNSPSQTVEGGLKKKKRSLTNTSEKEKIADFYIAGEKDYVLKTLRNAWMAGRNELKDTVNPITPERAKLVRHMQNVAAKMGQAVKAGKVIPKDAANRVLMQVYNAEAKQKRKQKAAEEMYQREIASGLYDYLKDIMPDEEIDFTPYDGAAAATGGDGFVAGATSTPPRQDDGFVTGPDSSQAPEGLDDVPLSDEEIQTVADTAINTNTTPQSAVREYAAENGIFLDADDEIADTAKVEQEISNVNQAQTQAKTLEAMIAQITAENKNNPDKDAVGRLYFEAIRLMDKAKEVIENAKKADVVVVAEPKKPDAPKDTKTVHSSTPPQNRMAGKQYKSQMVTLDSGVEIDGANDFQYYKTDADYTAIFFDGNAVGRLYNKDGKFTIMRQSAPGDKKPFRSMGPYSSAQSLMRAVPTIFQDHVAVTQARDNRFTVNEHAVGAPHFNEVPTETLTHRNEKTVQLDAEEPVTPLVDPAPLPDPEDMTTWTQADFQLSPGYQLAVQIIDTRAGDRMGAVKVASRSKPVQIKQILGRDLSENGYSYVIGTVQKGSNQFKSQETFRPLDPTDTFVTHRGEQLTGTEMADLEMSAGNVLAPTTIQSGRRRATAPVNMDTIKGQPLSTKLTTPAELKALNDMGVSTVGELIDQIEITEMTPFKQMTTPEEFLATLDARAMMARLLKAHVPNGLKKTNSRMAKATNEIRAIFDGEDPREAQTCIDFLERLSQRTGGVVPRFEANDASFYSQNAPGHSVKKRNKIFLNTQTDDPHATPLTFQLIHETAHWLYGNVLTEADKDVFWSSMSQFYKNGQLDLNALAQKSGRTDVIHNAMADPGELFANQFAKYALDAHNDIVRVPGGKLADLFHKVSRFGHLILKWMRGGTEPFMKQDADLAKIFQRILPPTAIDPATDAPYKGISKFAHLIDAGRKFGVPSIRQTRSMHPDEAEMMPAEFAAKQLVMLDDRIVKLQGAKAFAPAETGDSYGLAVELEQIGREIYGEYGGKKGEQFHQTSKRAKDGGGTARIMALDYTSARQPIMEAQYRIHAFLHELRKGNTVVPSGPDTAQTMTKTLGLNEGQREMDVIIGEQAQGFTVEAQEVMQRLMAEQKSGYQSLEQAVVVHLHSLSTDLQNALMGGVKEYSMMYQRMMPSTKKGEFVGIDPYTAQSTVKSYGKISSYHINKNRQINERNLATQVAVAEAVDWANSAGVDVHDASVKDIAAKVAAEMAGEQELNNAIANQNKSATGDVYNAVSAIEEKRTRSNRTTETDVAIAQDKVSEDEDMAAAVEGILRSGTIEQKEALLQHAKETNNSAILTLINASGYRPEDTPNLQTHAPSMAIENLVADTTHREKPTQGVARKLFNRFAQLLGKTGEDDFLSEFDFAVLSGKDVSEMSLMHPANKGGNLSVEKFDDEKPVTSDHADYKSVRSGLRKISKNITKLNELRQNAEDAANDARKLKDRAMYPGADGKTSKLLYEQAKMDMAAYDQESEALRAEIFPQLFDIAFRMQLPEDRRAVQILALAKEGQTKTVLERYEATILKGGNIGDKVKGKEAMVLNNIARDVAAMLEGVLVMPKSDYEKRLEPNRIIYNDPGLPEREENAVLSQLVDRQGETRIHPSLVGAFTTRFIRMLNNDSSMSRGVQNFLGNSNFRKNLRFNVTNGGTASYRNEAAHGPFGYGVYTKTANAVDRRYDPEELVFRVNDGIEAAGLAPAERQYAEISLKNILAIREKIRDAQLEDGRYSSDYLGHLIDIERKHWEVLDNLTNGNVVDQKVTPVFLRSRNPFDATRNSAYFMNIEYGKQRGGGIDGVDASHVLSTMFANELISPEHAETLIDAITTGLGFTGRELYDGLLNAVLVSQKHYNKAAGRATLNGHLQSIGYDGIQADEGHMAFNSADVLSATTTKYDFIEGTVLSDEPFEAGSDLKLQAEIVEEMMVTNDTLPNHLFLGATLRSQQLGLPKPVVGVVEKLTKGRDLNEDDVHTISKWSSVKNFFRENSSMFRHNGVNWFADLVKPVGGAGTFEMHDAMLARRLQPIIAKLDALPDGGTNLSRWGRRSRGLAMGALSTGQPASHKRIIQALRRGRGAVQRLKQEERTIALDIGQAFNDELKRMKDLGIKVGDARNLGSDFYVPQIWDKEAILENPGRFRAGLVAMLQREQMQPDFDDVKKSTDELKDIAKKVAHKIMKGHDPSLDGEVQTALGNPFASRVLRLKPGDYEVMDGFLEQDLQGIMAKYYDRTIRKRVLTEQFGINGHAFDTYIDVASNGMDGAIARLMNTYRQNQTVNTESGMAQVDDITVSALPKSRDEVKAVIEDVMRALGSDPKDKVAGKQKAMSILTKAAGPEGLKVQYQKRAEAIVNAMVDFPDAPISGNTVVKMRQMMDVLNKKPIDGGTGQEARYKISRALKSFTSVSLLGFTAFTSIPDLALPLVRSGNMKAFAKAWGKYMTDPSYRQSAKNIGVGIENLMHERMVHMAGDGNQKFANAFFNATLLTPWTNTMREAASLVGFESFKAEIDRAMRMKRMGKTGTRSYQTAVRYLERYGLTGENAAHDFLSTGAHRLDSLPKNEAIEMQVQMAMLRFTNEAIFTPNPNDVPLWGQGPWGSMIFQLKSFPFMMQRMGKYMMDERSHGNWYPLIYMATAGVGMGAVSMGVKDHLQFRGGEDERSFAGRDRSMTASKQGLAEVLGIEEDSLTDEYLGVWIDGLLAVGGLGFLGEALYNGAANAEGNFGAMRTLSTLAGPQVGTYEVAFSVGAGLKEQVQNAILDEDENNATRVAARNVLRRVPVGGGVTSAKEALVDKIAGEAQGRKKKKSGKFGSGLSSDFNSSEFGGKFD